MFYSRAEEHLTRVLDNRLKISEIRRVITGISNWLLEQNENVFEGDIDRYRNKAYSSYH